MSVETPPPMRTIRFIFWSLSVVEQVIGFKTPPASLKILAPTLQDAQCNC
jgi:hypothetical protein